VPTYAGGMLALVAAGESRDALCPPRKVLRERYPTIQGGTRYYSPEIHRAAFTLAPSFAPRALREPMPEVVLKTGS
jgi:spermidine synthase